MLLRKLAHFADGDVTFQSSDGVLFRVHRKNLEVCADGFPPSGFAVANGEIIPLSETSVTLDLLFQFMYPRRHPALDTTPFDVLEPLAEAAEKYQVFPAMNICHIRLRDMVHEHPVEVAIYAAKHDYPFLISEVAPMMISMPPVDVMRILPQSLVLPWVCKYSCGIECNFTDHRKKDSICPGMGPCTPGSRSPPPFGVFTPV
ncbi:hypothetical protein GGX14DRAFT_381746 [Mycena pura]|uniref:BTB domain-containing protein n=1 Tax=Mycena pura TaxID=153505 RepID=A0AAD6UMU8_9AGAR|nr:hypothetical protein GGX14DRAFT_381746 [Mycena pura]